VIWLRTLARATGITKPLAWILNGAGYETRYDAAFATALRTNDVVWDVGANVGHYTKSFSERVGTQGRVVAFEPSTVNFPRLLQATQFLANVTLINCGLGKYDDRMYFEQGVDELGATSRVSGSAATGTLVDIRSGKSLVTAGDAPTPNALKIDVEGHEYEVLLGLGDVLQNRGLRLVGIEVHFEILQQRGEPRIPGEIESLL
jgi:FkbM family methyltransferase